MSDILYEKKYHVAVATFDRPDLLNAFRHATFEELHRVFDDVQADEDIRVLILTGKGRAFSAGIDLKETAHLFGEEVFLKESRDPLLSLQDITRRMDDRRRQRRNRRCF